MSTILNNDIDNILGNSSGSDITAEEYREAVHHLLDAGPGVLAQNVGMPDPVIYRSDVATAWDKHMVETTLLTWPDEVPENAQRNADAMAKLVSLGTDPLQLTIEACRARGTPIVASYRMNAEDWYHHTWRLSDFGRAHPEWRVPVSDDVKAEAKQRGVTVQDFLGNLDPAVPEVFEHRMKIFAEVAEKYDIDGIEFDFRRWFNMISDPHQNHPILTRMVRDTRRMLDAVAKQKGRARMLLGARVGAMLEGVYRKEDFPGATATEASGGNASCRDLGLDIETWVKEELVDYLCPSLWYPCLPGLPRTAEFASLAENKPVGIYPSIFPLPAWGADTTSIPDMAAGDVTRMTRRHRDEICRAALQCYADGADGISTFNWYGHAQFSHLIGQRGPELKTYRGSLPCMETLLFIHRFLGSAEALRECLRQDH